MKKLAWTLVVFSLLVLPSAAEATKSKLYGTWKAVDMRRGNQSKKPPKGFSILVRFKKKGVFVTEIKTPQKTRSKKGTWKVRKGKLVTKVGGETDIMSYKVKGKKLILSKVGKSPQEIVIFKKQ